MFIVFISFRRQFGTPEVFFPLSPSLRLKLLCAPLVMLTYLCFYLPLFLSFFLSFSILFLFFLSFSLSLCFFSFPFFFSFWCPFGDPGGPGPPKPPIYAPAFMFSLSTRLFMPLTFFVLSCRKFQPILQKVESRGRCCLLTFLPYFFDFPLVKHPPMPCRLILCVSKTFCFLMPLLCWTQTIFTYSS